MNDLFTTGAIARKKLVEDAGGPTKLAPLVSMQPGVLANKANLTITRNQFTAEENLTLMLATKDYGPIQADATTLGGVFVLLPTGLEKLDDEGIYQKHLELIKELGESSKTLMDAKADGKIDQLELREIRREFYEDIAVIQELLNLIYLRAEEDAQS